MKREQDVREILIGNTIRLIAEGGFEKATTKAITYSGENVTDLKMNEVYIYRLFGNKEHLYDTVFKCLDREFLYALRGVVSDAARFDNHVRQKLYEAFLRVWRFVLQNEERCRCYMQMAQTLSSNPFIPTVIRARKVG